MSLRRITALILCAAMVLLGGCTIIDIDEELKQQYENEKVIIEYNGKNITKYDVTLNMKKILASQGQTVEEKMEDKDNWPIFKENVIKEMAIFELAMEKAAELGLDQLTEEEEAEIDEEYNKYLENAKGYVEPTVKQAVKNNPELNYDEEYARQLDSYLNAFGYTAATYREQLKREHIFEKVKEHFVSDVTVTEEDIQNYYDTYSSLQKSNIELDPSAFGLQQGFGIVLYYPEGYKSVKHIYVPYDDEIANEAFKAYYYNDTEEYEAAVEKGLAALKPQLDEIMSRLKAGEDFAALMTEYNKDTTMDVEPRKTEGVIVGPYSRTEVPGYAEAAEPLSPGQFSEPFGGPTGAYILRCEKLVDGAVPLADVHDKIYETLMIERTDVKWAQLTKEWVDTAVKEGKLKMHPGRF